MKTIKSTILALSSIALFAFTVPEGAIALWTQTTVDLGQIEHNVPASATFELTNDGDEPLILTNVRPTCGCTVADYPRTPIQPGQTVEITASYNAKNMGRFRKTVAVTTNTEQSTYTLVLQGEVVEK
ncbi:DUF1573 domain-containing protein [Phaeocystidibacter luteus]|uniref:DUF1573 domain-containing protein n=1 Tax=Phaeocystidibacter luteus TaxID=911197 RepID=A0A6N6RIQ6_9FLAO|nr:DUF1573 domain-containing protein [Phaeocystidibacter luteus]KAB2810258.1 DUF1573 domain-containing protein [Phaeocystidibacter luteus]